MLVLLVHVNTISAVTVVRLLTGYLLFMIGYLSSFYCNGATLMAR